MYFKCHEAKIILPPNHGGEGPKGPKLCTTLFEGKSKRCVEAAPCCAKAIHANTASRQQYFISHMSDAFLLLWAAKWCFHTACFFVKISARRCFVFDCFSFGRSDPMQELFQSTLPMNVYGVCFNSLARSQATNGDKKLCVRCRFAQHEAWLNRNRYLIVAALRGNFSRTRGQLKCKSRTP